MSESSTQGKTPGWEALLRRYWGWLLVGLTILVVLTVRVRLREMPLERDEGEYAYAGQLILQGIPPYKDVYNMKLPGTYAAYAVIMAVFGQTPSGIHLGVALVNVASIVLVFLIGRKLLDETAGVVAAAVFALMSMSPSVLGLAGHATHFVALFALAGTWLLLRAPPLPIPGRALSPKPPGQTAPVAGKTVGQSGSDPKPPSSSPFASQLSTLNSQLPFLSAGLCLGLAFLMKQHGLFFGLFGILFLCWRWIEPRLPRDNRAVEAKVRWKMSNLARKEGPEMAAKARSRHHSRTAAAPAALATTAVTPAPGRRLSLMAQDKLKSKDHGPETGDSRLETADNRPGTSSPAQQLDNPQLSPPAQQPTNSQLSTLNSQLSSPVQQPTASQLSTLNSQLPSSDPTSDLRPPTSPGIPAVRHPKAALPSFSSLAAQLLFLCTGLALPFLLTCLVLWIAGVFPQFWFWTISYAAKYASALSMSEGVEPFRNAVNAITGPNLGFWILGLTGVLVMWWDWRLKIEHRFMLVALLLCACASVSVGFYFRGHYFIPLLPVLGLLAGVAVSRAVWLVRNDRSIELLLAAGILIVFAVGLGAPFVGHGMLWMTTRPEQAMKEVYSTSLFGEAEKVGAFIETDSARTARVAVLGSEPEIYFYANRRSATGYIYAYPLMEQHEYARQMQDEMIAEIERAKPEYVVYVDDLYSWLKNPDSHKKLFDWWEHYWPEHMMLARSSPVESETQSDLLPQAGVKMREGTTRHVGNIMVFKRK